MARRATFVDSIRATGVPLLLVEGGGFLPRSDRVFVITRAIWDEIARLDYDAVGIGLTEIGHWRSLDSLRTHRPLPLLSTNVEEMVDGTWTPLGDKTRIIERAGVRVGLMSVVSDSLIDDRILGKSGAELRLLNDMETIDRYSGILRREADIVVLIAYASSDDMERYARMHPDVDMIIGGHKERQDEGALLVGGTILNRAGTRGRYMGSTRLIVSPDNQIVDFGGLNVGLSEEIKEDPEVAKRAEEAVALGKASAGGGWRPAQD